MRKVAIIIPVFNRINHTKKIYELLSKQLTNFNLIKIFIDSGSTDGTKEFLKEKKTLIIELDNTNWWSSAVYEGVLKALKINCEIIIIINDDIIFDENMIQNLCISIISNQNSLITTKQKTKNNKIYLGFTISKYGNIKPNNIDKEKFVKIDFFNGCIIGGMSSLFINNTFFYPKHCPHYYGDLLLYLIAKSKKIDVLIDTQIKIKQSSITDPRSKFRNLFFDIGSPCHFNSIFFIIKIILISKRINKLLIFSLIKIYILTSIKYLKK